MSFPHYYESFDYAQMLRDFPVGADFTAGFARLSADEVASVVAGIVADLGAAGPGDMGKVMGAAKAQLAGKAEMGAISAAVKAALSR